MISDQYKQKNYWQKFVSIFLIPVKIFRQNYDGGNLKHYYPMDNCHKTFKISMIPVQPKSTTYFFVHPSKGNSGDFFWGGRILYRLNSPLGSIFLIILNSRRNKPMAYQKQVFYCTNFPCIYPEDNQAPLSSAIFLRASTKTSYAGCPFDKRIIRLRE